MSDPSPGQIPNASQEEQPSRLMNPTTNPSNIINDNNTMDNHGNEKLYSRPIVKLACMAAIGGFLFGYDTGVISGVILILTMQWNLTDIWAELIVSATIGAAALSSGFTGYLSNGIGRKLTIIISSLLFTIGGVVMASASEKGVLLVGRLIVGAAIGVASSTIPLYIAETAPAQIRGRLTAIYQLLITFGFLVSSLVDASFNQIFPQLYSWRLMLGLGALPGVIQFFGFLGMPETPRWLLMQGKADQALNVLLKLGREESEAQKEVELISTDITRSQVYNSKGLIVTKMLETGPTRRALIISCLLMFYQQMCGINSVLYYSASMFKMAGVKSAETAIWLTVLTSAVNFFPTFLGFILVERVGRRKLLLGSMSVVVFGLLLLGISFSLIARESSEQMSMVDLDDGSNPCSANSNCNSCSYDVRCGFCYEPPQTNESLMNHSLASMQGGVCVPSNPIFHNAYGTFGNCSKNATDDKGFEWAFGWCQNHFYWVTAIGATVFLCGFSAGLGPVPWIYMAEIFPTWARATGNSIGTSVNWTSDLVISLTFLSLGRAMTREGIFFLYGVITISGVAFFWWTLPETMGKSIDDIEEIFEQPICSSRSHHLEIPMRGSPRKDNYNRLGD